MERSDYLKFVAFLLTNAFLALVFQGIIGIPQPETFPKTFLLEVLTVSFLVRIAYKNMHGIWQVVFGSLLGSVASCALHGNLESIGLHVLFGTLLNTLIFALSVPIMDHLLPFHEHRWLPALFLIICQLIYPNAMRNTLAHTTASEIWIILKIILAPTTLGLTTMYVSAIASTLAVMIFPGIYHPHATVAQYTYVAVVVFALTSAIIAIFGSTFDLAEVVVYTAILFPLQVGLTYLHFNRKE